MPRRPIRSAASRPPPARPPGPRWSTVVVLLGIAGALLLPHPTLLGSARTIGVAPPRGLDPFAAPVPSGPAFDPASAPRSAQPSGYPNIVLSGSTVLNLSRSLSIENLVVSGSAQFIFGNSSWTATLSIYGDVFLSGSAHVRWWDAYVDLEETYTQEQSVYVNGSARLTLNEAFVSSNGLSWDGESYGTSNVTVLSSEISAHTVFQFHDSTTAYIVNSKVSADLQPSGNATIYQATSAGSAFWFPFADGNTGEYSFPAPDLETSWSFPPNGTSGIGYRIDLVEDWPSLFATTLYPGSNVTIANTSGLDATFLPVGGSLVGAGFRFGENPNFTFATSQFRLHLVNVSIDSWAFYPVDSSLTLSDSQLGEVNGWASTMDLVGSNLTYNGGYYAAFENSTLAISNCTIGSTVEGYDTSNVTVSNSSVDADESIIAVNNASITATNVSLGTGATYQAQQSGTITVRAGWTVTPSEAGRPVPGATIRAVGGGPLPVDVTALTGSDGSAWLALPMEEVDAAGTVRAGPIDLFAASAGDIAETVTGGGPSGAWAAPLTPWVASTSPSNGSAGVAADTPIEISFADPMNESATDAAIAVTPNVPVSIAGWSLNGTVVALVPTLNWTSGTTVSVTVGDGASTVLGFGAPGPFTFAFSIVPEVPPPPVPAVSGTDPAGNETNVSLRSAIAVAFTAPMAPGPTVSAFSATPALPAGTIEVNGSVLLWTGAAPLAPSTTYVVTIAATATSTVGVPLSAAYRFSFSTVSSSEVPVLLDADPSNGSRLAAAPTAIVLTFSVPMDPAGTVGAFAIAPSVPGAVTVSGPSVTFTPAEALPANQTYVVSVGLGATSASGVPLLDPVRVSFTVLAIPTPPGHSSSGTTTTPAKGSSGNPDLEIAVTGIVVGAVALGAGVLIGRRARPPSGP